MNTEYYFSGYGTFTVVGFMEMLELHMREYHGGDHECEVQLQHPWKCWCGWILHEVNISCGHTLREHADALIGMYQNPGSWVHEHEEAFVHMICTHLHLDGNPFDYETQAYLNGIIDHFMGGIPGVVVEFSVPTADPRGKPWLFALGEVIADVLSGLGAEGFGDPGDEAPFHWDIPEDPTIH